MTAHPLSPLGLLGRAARLWPNEPAVAYGDATWSFAEFDRRCRKLAGGLAGAGVTAGDRVAVLAPNTPALLECHFAAPMAGAAVVAIDPRLTGPEVAALLADCRPRLFLVDPEFAAVAVDALGRLDAGARPIVVDIDDPRAPRAAPIGRTTLGRIAAEGDPAFEWPGCAAETDPICISYSAGPEGRPRGFAFSHRAALLAALGNSGPFRLWPLASFLWSLPMHQAGGWGNAWALVAQGVTQVCLRSIAPTALFALIDRHMVTHMAGTVALLGGLAETPADLARRSAHSVEFLVTDLIGPPAAMLAATDRLGFNVGRVFGLPEAMGPLTGCMSTEDWDDLPLRERAYRLGRLGLPLAPATEVRVADPASGLAVACDGGTRGELMLRGATCAADRQETWIATGRLAVVDPDGRLDAREDRRGFILTQGETVSPAEVEAVLVDHPAIARAAVVGRPDERYGEVVFAFIVPSDPSADPPLAEIEAHCRQRLAPFKRPRQFVAGPLPIAGDGTIDRALLRAIAAHDPSGEKPLHG